MDLSGVGRAMARAAETAQRLAAERQRAQAQAILDLAQERAPVETGRLRNSGRVEADAAAMTARVVFDAPYAAIVHERLDIAHPRGRAHFLSSATQDVAASG